MSPVAPERTDVSRRTFLRATALAGGSVVFSFGWRPDLAAAQRPAASFQPNGFVRIDPDGGLGDLAPRARELLGGGALHRAERDAHVAACWGVHGA